MAGGTQRADSNTLSNFGHPHLAITQTIDAGHSLFNEIGFLDSTRSCGGAYHASRISNSGFSWLPNLWVINSPGGRLQTWHSHTVSNPVLLLVQPILKSASVPLNAWAENALIPLANFVIRSFAILRVELDDRNQTRWEVLQASLEKVNYLNIIRRDAVADKYD